MESKKKNFFPVRNHRLWQLSGSCDEFWLIYVCQLLSSTLEFDKFMAKFFFCLFFSLLAIGTVEQRFMQLVSTDLCVPSSCLFLLVLAWWFMRLVR